jgi:GNAT superfamily N-acetyltransferase
MGELFHIRDGRDSDLEYLDYYAALEGMDNMPGIERIRVAVNKDDVPVGFCRLQADRNGISYVNPIVVSEAWRGYGVGRALISDARSIAGELRLVSRGSSAGFYETLGFAPLDWSQVDLEAASEDCDNCPMRTECNPVPMQIQ